MSMQKSVQQCSSCFIHNSQKTETTQTSIDRGMDKSNVACLTKEYCLAMKMNELLTHVTAWVNLDYCAK